MWWLIIIVSFICTFYTRSNRTSISQPSSILATSTEQSRMPYSKSTSLKSLLSASASGSKTSPLLTMSFSEKMHKCWSNLKYKCWFSNWCPMSILKDKSLKLTKRMESLSASWESWRVEFLQKTCTKEVYSTETTGFSPTTKTKPLRGELVSWWDSELIAQVRLKLCRLE